MMESSGCLITTCSTTSSGCTGLDSLTSDGLLLNSGLVSASPGLPAISRRSLLSRLRKRVWWSSFSHRYVSSSGTFTNTDNYQLDDRYFTDLKGQYQFVLNFLLKSPGEKTPICSVRPVHQWDRRSVNCEVELEPGTYEVVP